MRINVTQDDIDRGTKGDSWDCPIARATVRAAKRHRLAWLVGVSVGPTHIHFAAVRGFREPAVMPERVTEWIGRFDVGRTVRPIRFEVRIPNAVA